MATGDPLDKAGAYAIQHPEFHPVGKLDGCYASVMGLPMCHVILLLRKMDVQPNADVFAGCETLLEYQCPVSNTLFNSAIASTEEGEVTICTAIVEIKCHGNSWQFMANRAVQVQVLLALWRSSATPRNDIKNRLKGKA